MTTNRGQSRFVWAVEVTDPKWGTTIKAPFAFKEHADLYAREEVAAAQELFHAKIEARVFRLDRDAQ